MNDCNSHKTELAARLPAGYLFTSSHFWFIPAAAPGRWRVGITEFALRMLGELVVVEFEKQPGSPVAQGDVLGLIEGFKAISDLYCLGSGAFEGGNPALKKSLDQLDKDPYGAGWLYEFTGEPDPQRLDATGYRELLGVAIDRIRAARCPEDQSS